MPVGEQAVERPDLPTLACLTASPTGKGIPRPAHAGLSVGDTDPALPRRGRKNPEDHGSIKPFTEDAIDVILSRSDGKPRDLLRKSFALIDQGATRNWDEITGARAADILDSLSFADDDYVAPTGITRAPLEEQWT